MKKYKLKKQYKKALIYLFSVFCLVSLMFGIIALYNARVDSIENKKPGSIEIKK